MWLKLSDDFADDLYRDQLSDSAFRTHVEGLAWSCRHLLDGRLPRRSLMRFAFSDDPEAAAAELVAAGYWQQDADAWLIVHHIEHQADRDAVLRRRRVDAQRQARNREKRLQQAESRSESDRESRRDTHCDDPRDPGRVGTGLAGSGRDGKSAVTNTENGGGEDRDAERVERLTRAHGSGGRQICGWCSQEHAPTEPHGRSSTFQDRPWCGICEPGGNSDAVCTVDGCKRAATVVDADGSSPLCETHRGAAWGQVVPIGGGAT
jgi:hypothetical protein